MLGVRRSTASGLAGADPMVPRGTSALTPLGEARPTPRLARRQRVARRSTWNIPARSAPRGETHATDRRTPTCRTAFHVERSREHLDSGHKHGGEPPRAPGGPLDGGRTWASSRCIQPEAPPEPGAEVPGAPGSREVAATGPSAESSRTAPPTRVADRSFEIPAAREGTPGRLTGAPQLHGMA